MILNFDPRTSKCKGTFLSPSCIYVWNMNAVCWKFLQLFCQNQSLDKVPLCPWPLNPQMSMYLPLTILHLCMKYEKLYVENYSSYRVRTKGLTMFRCDLDHFTPKCKGIFLSPSCIYVCKLYVEKLLRYRVRTKGLTKFRCDLDLWLWPIKGIDIFLS